MTVSFLTLDVSFNEVKAGADACNAWDARGSLGDMQGAGIDIRLASEGAAPCTGLLESFGAKLCTS